MNHTPANAKMRFIDFDMKSMHFNGWMGGWFKSHFKNCLKQGCQLK